MTSLQIYDPFTDAGIDKLFRGFFRPVLFERNRAQPIAIKMDVTETEKGYTIRAEMPGVKKDDIKVTVEGNQVTIGAEVKRESEQKDGERLLRTERSYGSAYRSFVLPAEVDESASEARYDNGVLELKLSKKAAVAGRKITIQ
jgi:HSP20 family protein